MIRLAFVFSTCALLACSPSGAETGPDAAPIHIKRPQPTEEPTDCDGISQRGECQDGVAVYCDLDLGEARRIDCVALGEECVEDFAHGVLCKEVEVEKPDEPVAGICAILGDRGECINGAAFWCNTEVQELWTYDCREYGLRCGVDECAGGAFCCDQPRTECDALGLAGQCVNGKVMYCDAGTIEELTCVGGLTCKENVCFDGAACCN